MRIHRQIRRLRRPVNPNINRHRKDRTNVELNSEKTKNDYLYFDTIFQKNTNTFIRKHNTSVNNKPNNNNGYEIGNLDNSRKQIKFSTTEDTDDYTIKDIITKKLTNTNNYNVNKNTSVPVLFENSNSILFASNNGYKDEVIIPVNNSIPFNNLSVNSGSSISQVKDDVFKINTPGTFKINFILYTAKSSPLGSAGIVVDDNPIDKPTTLITAGTPIVSHGIFHLKNGDHTVKIVVSDLDLCLSPLKNASIIIEQLN